MKRGNKALKIIYTIFAILSVISALLTALLIMTFDKEYGAPRFNNHVIISVTDKEMSPKILKGSAILSDLSYEEINQGDNIIIMTKDSNGVRFTVREVQKVAKEHYTVSGTRNSTSFNVTKKSVVAVGGFQFYALGAYIEAIRTQAGFFMLVVIPLLIVIIVQIVNVALLIIKRRLEEKYALINELGKAELEGEEDE